VTEDELRVQAELLELLETLSGDWEHDGEIGPDTRFLADLELESLDLVVLGELVQSTYGRLPFAEYLAKIGERPLDERDVSVADLVRFICTHKGYATSGIGEPA